MDKVPQANKYVSLVLVVDIGNGGSFRTSLEKKVDGGRFRKMGLIGEFGGRHRQKSALIFIKFEVSDIYHHFKILYDIYHHFPIPTTT